MLRTCAALALALALAVSAAAVSVPDAIDRAEEHRAAGRLGEAVSVMEEAVAGNPEDVKAHAHLGLYLGMSAGEAEDMMKASELIERAYEHLDRAVILEPRDPHARHFRGLIGVNVPAFLGKLPGALADLEQVITMYRAAPDQVPLDIVVSSHLLLGQGRERQGNYIAAKEAWLNVLDLAPGTSAAETARAGIERARQAREAGTPGSEPVPEGVRETEAMLEAARALMDAGRHVEAAAVLRAVVEHDPSSVEAHLLLLRSVGELAGRGYDERIAGDTDLRTNLALEMMEVADRAVELAPDNMEVRLTRGALAVELPFFVNALDRGVQDLERVIESDAPEALKAEARYYLGRAFEKRALSTWLEVISEHPNTAAADRVLEAMRPPVSHIDAGSLVRPAVVVEFVLGFRDELPPQTAVWIESAAGEYVATLYVSGFSGHARGEQVNLPVWAGTSGFEGIDAVTAASIDAGHHIVTWDLTDAGGNPVPDGDYVARIEVKYWPSMEGDLAEAPFTFGAEPARSLAAESRLIPYLEVRTLP